MVTEPLLENITEEVCGSEGIIMVDGVDVDVNVDDSDDEYARMEGDEVEVGSLISIVVLVVGVFVAVVTGRIIICAPPVLLRLGVDISSAPPQQNQQQKSSSSSN